MTILVQQAEVETLGQLSSSFIPEAFTGHFLCARPCSRHTDGSDIVPIFRDLTASRRRQTNLQLGYKVINVRPEVCRESCGSTVVGLSRS